MLGRRIAKSRIAIDSLVSSGTLGIIDDRLKQVFKSASNSGSTSPAALVVVLTSLGRLGVVESDLPISLPTILSYFTKISSSIDRRTFISIIRSLTLLKLNWSQLTSMQKAQLSSGIAKAASSAQPSRIASFLKVNSVMYIYHISYLHLFSAICPRR